MKLSKNFTLAELTVSQYAVRYGIPNTPGTQELANLKRLCKYILQPLRDEVGPITVSSGLRVPAVNAGVGGSKASQHLQGMAADIRCNSLTVLQLAQKIKAMGLPYHQLINEFGAWVHVGLAPDLKNPRRQEMTFRKINGRTVIENGLRSV